MGHEVTHARISQGTTRDRGTETLNEEYADSMGSYSADGMAFSSSTYNNVNLDSKLNTNKHIQTANDKELLNTNNESFKDRVKEDGDKVDFEAYWSLGDVDRMNTLSNPKTPIEEKINALVAVGLTPKEIKKSLGNNADFKALLKDGDEKFDTVYTEQKNKVDSVNNKVDVTVSTLEVLGNAALAGTAVVPFTEKMLKKEVSVTVAGAIEAGTIDLGAQYLLQTGRQVYDKNFDMSEVDYTDFTLDTTSLGFAMGAGSVLLPSIKTGTNSIIRSVIARQKYNKQISSANTSGKINKLTDRKEVHDKYLGTVLGIESASEGIPFIIDTTSDYLLKSSNMQEDKK